MCLSILEIAFVESHVRQARDEWRVPSEKKRSVISNRQRESREEEKQGLGREYEAFLTGHLKETPPGYPKGNQGALKICGRRSLISYPA